MLYLAVQFSWFLLAAFAIGLVFGWLTLGGPGHRFATGPMAGLAILWAALAALVWLRLVNDQAALWIETAVLYLPAYAAGCLVGSFFGAGGGEALPALAPPATRLALPQPAASLPPPTEAAEVSGAQEAAPTTKPKIENGTGSAGKRPTNLLPAARGGKPDNLGSIAGIDPAIAEKLNGLGLWHFDQIAALGPDELRFLADHAGLSEPDAAEGWKAEAEILAKGGETTHSRAVKGKRSRKKR